MVRFVLGLTLAAAVVPALANPSDCFSIRDPDARAYCRALSRGSLSDCASINDGQRRIACRAAVGGNSAECASLNTADARAFCRAQTR